MIKLKPQTAWPLFTGLTSLIIYIWGLHPTVSIEGDSGELIAAIHDFGIIHSPGFPGYVVLTKALTALIPFGDIAWKVNFASALWGALTVALVTHLCLLWGFGIMALAAGLLLAFTPEFWYASVAAEVYTLALLFLLLPAWLITISPQLSIKARSLLLGAALSLGISAHVYSWAMTPLWLLILGSMHFKQVLPLSWRFLSLGFALGFFPYIYMPFRAGASFYINEGGIDSFQRWFDHVTWILQRDRITSDANTPMTELFRVKMIQFEFLGRDILKQWRIWTWLWLSGWIAGLYSLARLTKSQVNKTPSHFAQWALGLGSIYMPLVVWLVFAGKRFEWGVMTEMAVHMLTFYATATPLVALALAQIPRPLVRAGLLVPFMALTLVRLPQHQFHDNRIAEVHALGLLDHLESNALLIADNDKDLMPAVYKMAVDNHRRDIILLNSRNSTEWYYDNLKRLYPTLNWPSYSPQFLQHLLKLNSERPLSFASNPAAITFLERAGWQNDYEIIPSLGSFRVRPKGQLQDLTTDPAELYQARKYDFLLRDTEVDIIAQWADYHLRRSEYFLRHQKLALAREEIAKASQFHHLDQTEFGRAIQQEISQLTLRLR